MRYKNYREQWIKTKDKLDEATARVEKFRRFINETPERRNEFIRFCVKEAGALDLLDEPMSSTPTQE